MTAPTTQQQGTHHFVITTQKAAPGGGGYSIHTWSGTFTPALDWTRQDAYEWLINEHYRHNPAAVGSAPIFFDLARNEL